MVGVYHWLYLYIADCTSLYIVIIVVIVIIIIIVVVVVRIQFVRNFRVYPRDQHEGSIPVFITGITCFIHTFYFYLDGKNSLKKKKSPLLYEDPFRPTFIYEMLTKAKSRLSVSVIKLITIID